MDTRIPNQVCLLLQSLEFAVDILENGATPEEIEKFIKLANDKMDFVRKSFEPEWDRM